MYHYYPKVRARPFGIKVKKCQKFVQKQACETIFWCLQNFNEVDVTESSPPPLAVVLHLWPSEPSVHSGGGDVRAPEGTDRETLWWSHWRMG